MTNRENTSPMKTCTNCGQQKPISAFLEMGGEQGTSYGNICSTCRKTTLDELQRRKKTDAEGSSTTTDVGHKIDTEAKIQGEIDKRELVQRIDDEYHAERKDNAEVNQTTQQIKANAELGQRKHREDFLKKRSFLGSTPNKDDKTSAAQLRTEMLRGNEKDAQQSDNRFADKLKTEHDFTVENQGQQIAGQLRFQGQTFQQFRQWLGNSAPIVNNLNQTKKDPQPTKPGAVADDVNKTKATPKHEEKTKDPAVEFVENNWRPGGGRKR